MGRSSRALRKLGEKTERIFCVAAWRESPYYSDAERAALALTEAASRLGDRADPVPDEVWNERDRAGLAGPQGTSTDDVGGIVVTATSIYWLNYTRAVMKLDKR